MNAVTFLIPALTNIPTETALCDVVRMILTMNNFTFNKQHYLQIHGIDRFHCHAINTAPKKNIGNRPV